MMFRPRSALLVIASTAALTLAGCATGPAPTSTSESGLSAGNAKLSVKMASSIFLQPVPPSERTVYLDGHNTSSAQGLNFTNMISQDLTSKGYRVVNDPTQAHYMLMWNILYIGKQTKSHTAAGALAGGYGGALIGALSSGHNSYAGGAEGAAVGVLAGALIGAYLSGHQYMMVVDIQAEQRQKGARMNSTTTASQGLGNKTVAQGAQVNGWGIYRDRVVAQAKGMRLTFAYAKPALVKETAGEVAGIF